MASSELRQQVPSATSLFNFMVVVLLHHHRMLVLCQSNSSFFDRRQGLTRQPEPNSGANMNQQRTNGSPSPSPTGYPQHPSSLTNSSSYSAQSEPGSETGSSAGEKQVKSDSKYFFQPRFAKLGVKGNFMPLAAQPANADLADWLAHQSLCNLLSKMGNVLTCSV